MDTYPSSPSLGNIPENYSSPTRVASKEKGKLNKGRGGKELKINLGCHQVYLDASPPFLSGRTRRDELGACVGKGKTKSGQGRKALVRKSVSTPI